MIECVECDLPSLKVKFQIVTCQTKGDKQHVFVPTLGVNSEINKGFFFKN